MNRNLVIDKPAGDAPEVANNKAMAAVASTSGSVRTAIPEAKPGDSIPKMTDERQTGQGTVTQSSSQTALAAPSPMIQRQLFAQSFVELSGAERSRRRWTQTSSFVVQMAIVGVLVLLPLWFTEILPAQQLATFLVVPPPPPPPPPPAAPTLKASRVVSEMVNGQLLAPNKIPQKIKDIAEEEAPAPVTGVIGGVVGGVPGGYAGGVIGSLISSTPHIANVAAVSVPKRIRISTGVSEGMLVRRVEPVYPVIAQRARIEGTVELRAVISKDGAIEGLQRVNGHPLLVTAAMDAVRQWRYRPYFLNGAPLEVETNVVVNFHMH